jgi:hypothetical protein
MQPRRGYLEFLVAVHDRVRNSPHRCPGKGRNRFESTVSHIPS